MSFQLPELGYNLADLEPHIDAKTMEIHHGKHHAGYVAKLNAAIEDSPLASKSIEEILQGISELSGGVQAAVRNNGGGHYNHQLFWTILSPNGGGEPTGEVAQAINDTFGDFEKFKEKFTHEAATRFGSGWAWLCVKDGSLCVCSSPNQDNPLMDISECPGIPILGLDVWEHAYYLNYQNRRPDYINAFFNVVNWSEVNRRYLDAQ